MCLTRHAGDDRERHNTSDKNSARHAHHPMHGRGGSDDEYLLEVHAAPPVHDSSGDAFESVAAVLQRL